MTWFALFLGCGGDPTAKTPTTPTETDADVDADTDADVDADTDADADADSGTTPIDTYTGTTPECAAVTAQWQADFQALVDSHASCVALDDCRLLAGPCDTSLGGCYVSANLDLLPNDVSTFEEDYRVALTEAGCHVPFGGCGCSVSYVAFCSEAGTCQLLALDPGD